MGASGGDDDGGDDAEGGSTVIHTVRMVCMDPNLGPLQHGNTAHKVQHVERFRLPAENAEVEPPGPPLALSREQHVDRPRARQGGLDRRDLAVQVEPFFKPGFHFIGSRVVATRMVLSSATTGPLYSACTQPHRCLARFGSARKHREIRRRERR
jgi:hypothetical protein